MNRNAIFIENRNPALVRQKRIDVNDERNIALRDKAGARTNVIVMAVIMLIALGLTLAGADLYVSLILFGLILVNAVLYVASFNYFSKRL